MSNRKIIEDNLEMMTHFSFYGIYYKGKLMDVSNARIYVQQHRPKTELVNRLRHMWDYDNKKSIYLDRNEIKKAIDELIDSGIIQIKKI